MENIFLLSKPKVVYLNLGADKFRFGFLHLFSKGEIKQNKKNYGIK